MQQMHHSSSSMDKQPSVCCSHQWRWSSICSHVWTGQAEDHGHQCVWVEEVQYIRKSVFQLTWFDIADVTFRRFLLLIQLWNRLGNRVASFFRLLSYVPPFFSISGWISWRKLKCSFPDAARTLYMWETYSFFTCTKIVSKQFNRFRHCLFDIFET